MCKKEVKTKCKTEEIQQRGGARGKIIKACKQKKFINGPCYRITSQKKNGREKNKGKAVAMLVKV